MARDDDQDEPLAKAKAIFEPRLLDALSVAEMERYIIDLKNEIPRVEEAIAARRRIRAGADSLFGRKNE